MPSEKRHRGQAIHDYCQRLGLDPTRVSVELVEQDHGFWVGVDHIVVQNPLPLVARDGSVAPGVIATDQVIQEAVDSILAGFQDKWALAVHKAKTPADRLLALQLVAEIANMRIESAKIAAYFAEQPDQGGNDDDKTR